MSALFALPVEVRRCRRNNKRLVIVSATGKMLLRTLSDSLLEQDIVERFARAMNEWAKEEERRLAAGRYGLTRPVQLETA